MDNELEKLELSFKISKAWEKNAPDTDPKGHKIGNPNFVFILLNELSKKDLLSLVQALESQVPSSDEITLKKSAFNICYTCGEEIVFKTDGLTVSSQSSCSYPNGIPLTFELNVPSGTMIVANDLRCHFDFAGDDYDINTRIGCVRTTKAMEAIGCAHAFVGNSCPGMYKVRENTFTISCGGYDYEKDEDVEPEGILVASIITDLWWYSIVDADEFEKRDCDKCHDEDYVTRVKVQPGVYRFTHFQHLDHEEDESSPFTYTKIEWISPARLVQN